MLASELIKQLQDKIDAYGDLEVFKYDFESFEYSSAEVLIGEDRNNEKCFII